MKDAEFIGKETYLKARADGPAAKLCTLMVDDHAGESGMPRFPAGSSEPILTLEEERLVDAKGRESFVTSAGAGPSLGQYLLLAYLPVEQAAPGNKLQVQYMNERFPVSVAPRSAMFDPENARMKA